MFIQLTRIGNKKQMPCIIALADIKMIDNRIEETDHYTTEHAKSSVWLYSSKQTIPVAETQEQIKEVLKAAGMLLKTNIKTSELDS